MRDQPNQQRITDRGADRHRRMSELIHFHSVHISYTRQLLTQGAPMNYETTKTRF